MYVNSLFLLSTLPCCKVLFASDKNHCTDFVEKSIKKMINFSNVVRIFISWKLPQTQKFGHS